MASDYGELDDLAHLLRAVDSRWFAVETIDSIHERVHQGILFTHEQVAVAGDPAELANDASLEYLITVPAGKFPHMRWAAECGGDSRVRIYEGVTTSDDGTEVTMLNRNRNSSNTAPITLHTGPTVSDYGTLLGDQVMPTGGGIFGIGGGAGAATIFGEWVLKPSTLYVVRLTNISGGAQPAGVEMRVYGR